MVKLCRQIQRWFVLKPMGTYRRPAPKYHRLRIGGTPFPKIRIALAALWGFLPSSLQTIHIHIGLFKLVHRIRFATTRSLFQA